MAKTNALKALKGEDLVREHIEYPPKPYLRVFVPAIRMREMVREANRHKANWVDMLSGHIKFVDLPIFKSLKL